MLEDERTFGLQVFVKPHPAPSASEHSLQRALQFVQETALSSSGSLGVDQCVTETVWGAGAGPSCRTPSTG